MSFEYPPGLSYKESTILVGIAKEKPKTKEDIIQAKETNWLLTYIRLISVLLIILMSIYAWNHGFFPR